MTTGAAAFLVTAFGVLVEVLPPDEETSARWQRQWSRALVTGPGAPDATLDAATTMRGEGVATTDYKMTTRLTQLALDRSRDRLNLHAAGLVDDHGRALALIAASGTGKTTATRELGRRLGYLTDETVSVAADLGVLPYPKPLSFVDDPRRPHDKSQLGPDELGLQVATSPARLQRLVLLDRDPGSATRGLTRLSTAEGIAAVMPQTSYVTSLRDPLLRMATALRSSGGAHRLTYAEITDHVDELVAFLAAPPAEPEEPFVHHPGALPATGPAGTLARAVWHDAVELDDTVVVLVGGTSFQLEGLGATIWLALRQPMSAAELVEVARDVHGDHPDAERLVSQSLASLQEAGIVAASESITLPEHDHQH